MRIDPSNARANFDKLKARAPQTLVPILRERPLLDMVAHFGSAIEMYRCVSVWNSFQSVLQKVKYKKARSKK